MNKQEFLTELKNELPGLPGEDVEERLSFYSEMIDDRVEDGMTEEEAVADVGSVEDVVSQILSEVPLAKIVKEKIRPKRSLRAWEIVLIVLGFPVWFPLLVAGAAVALALYIVLWALVVCLWAVLLAFAVCFAGGIALAVVYAVRGFGMPAVAMAGAALFAAGVSIFVFHGCVAASKGAAKLAKKTVLGLKARCARKKGN